MFCSPSVSMSCMGMCINKSLPCILIQDLLFEYYHNRPIIEYVFKQNHIGIQYTCGCPFSGASSHIAHMSLGRVTTQAAGQVVDNR